MYHRRGGNFQVRTQDQSRRRHRWYDRLLFWVFYVSFPFPGLFPTFFDEEKTEIVRLHVQQFNFLRIVFSHFTVIALSLIGGEVKK